MTLAAGSASLSPTRSTVGGPLGPRVAALAGKHGGRYLAENLDWAIEWCEDQLNRRNSPPAYRATGRGGSRQQA